jgi:GNAT superfamily N-acetyltransferase
MTSAEASIQTYALTPDRWADFAVLMNSRFDTRHCWCMAMRLPVSYQSRSGDANRRSMKDVVDTAVAPPGVLAYVDGAPVGWCAVAPREEYRWLARFRATSPIDEQPAWSVVCFYVLRAHRRSGVSRALLSAAVHLAVRRGAKIIEAYPVEGGRNQFRGVVSVFKSAGFEEVARKQPNRPFLRYRATASKSPGPKAQKRGV